VPFVLVEWQWRAMLASSQLQVAATPLPAAAAAAAESAAGTDALATDPWTAVVY